MLKAAGSGSLAEFCIVVVTFGLSDRFEGVPGSCISLILSATVAPLRFYQFRQLLQSARSIFASFASWSNVSTV